MVKMAGSGEPFDDLNRLFANLGFSGNDDADKKKRGGRGNGGDDDKEWSFGEKVAVGVGVGLAAGAGIAALSYLFSGSDDNPKPPESRSLPSRGFGYDGEDDDSSHDENVGRLELQAQSAFRSTTRRESRRYGYFRCNNCQNTWESAYTFSKGKNAVSSIFHEFIIHEYCNV